MTDVNLAQIYLANSSFERELDRLREGKRDISNTLYLVLWLVSALILGCLSFQNALYGWYQSQALVGAVCLAILLGAGDYALSTIMGIYGRGKWGGCFAVLSSGCLVLLSFTAGLAFLLMLGHQNDIASSEVGRLRAEIETNRVLFEKYGQTRTSNRLQDLKKQLAEAMEETGADKSSINAIYFQIAGWTGYDYGAVSLVVRAFWIIVMILTSMNLACLKGSVWCPWKEAAAIRELTTKERTKLKAERAQLKLEQGRALIASQRSELARQIAAENQSGISIGGESAPPAQGHVPRKEHKSSRVNKSGKTRRKAPHIDTVASLILSGEVKPSRRSLEKLGMTNTTALQMLRDLAAKGVVARDGKRYVPIMA